MVYSGSSDISGSQPKRRTHKRAMPTPSELRLRREIRSNRIPIEYDKAIKYSLSHSYVPDIIVGGNLIVEVDGGVHYLKSKITPDRIRQRALEMMGYTVLRVSNYEVWKYPEKTTEKIIQKFYEVTGVEGKKSIIQINASSNKHRRIYYKELKKVISELSFCDILLEMDTEAFKEKVDSIVNGFSESPWAVETFLFTVFGSKLKKSQKGNYLDFEDAANTFKKIMDLATRMFGEVAAISLKNQLLVTGPNFIKNLVFNGAPNSQNRIVTISSEKDMLMNIYEFNNFFSPLGVTVEKENVLVECCKALNPGSSNYEWLSPLCLNSKSDIREI